MYYESNRRSLLKTVSYRLWSTILTSLLVYVFTGQWMMALAIGSLEVLLKMFLYYGHERVWDRIQFGRKVAVPAVIWLTGLPCSGKSTLALALAEEFKQLKLKSEILDGATIRKLFPKVGFSREERNLHIERMGYLASRLEAHQIFVIATSISPYTEGRDFVRGLCQHFVEVHLNTPLETCEQWDLKGRYQRARAGELAAFTGVSDAYEIPQTPELRLDMSQQTPQQAAQEVLKYLRQQKLI